MGPHTELFQALRRRFPDVSQEDVAALALRIAEPQKVMLNMSHLVVYYIDEDQKITEDRVFSDLVARDHAKVRIMLVKGEAKVFLGPAWYDGEDKPQHSYIGWDGRCTCRWESSNYFDGEAAEDYVKEAKAHLEEKH